MVVAEDSPEAIGAAIAAVCAAGPALRETTAQWFSSNEERLSLEHSLREVLDSYRGAGGA
jgi:hypothetical protein